MESTDGIKVRSAYMTQTLEPFYGYLYHWGGEEVIDRFRGIGVHLYCGSIGGIGWVGENEYNFDEIDAFVEELVQADPNMVLCPRIGLEAPSWWLDIHKEQLFVRDDGVTITQSFASRVWRNDAGEALRKFLEHVKSAWYADRILGFLLCAGNSAEWFYHIYYSEGGVKLVQPFTVDCSEIMRQEFIRWLSEKYSDVDTLRKAWGESGIFFDGVQIPNAMERAETHVGSLIDPQKGRKVLDFWECYNDVMADSILHFARIFKETADRFLCGFFYGYTLNWLCTFLGKHTGHLSLWKVLESPHIDFLAGPNIYERNLGRMTAFMAPSGSVKAHGKLWIAECDTRTHKADKGQTWRGMSVPANLHESIALLRKDFSKVLTHDAGLWWFDMYGNWFSDREVLEDFKAMKRILNDAQSSTNSTKHEIALIIDEKSLYYIGMDRFYTGGGENTHFALGRIGTSYDVFLLSDIGYVDMSQYKLVIFMDCYKVTVQERAAIEGVLKKEGRTILWLNATGVINEDSLNIANASALTEMALKLHIGPRQLIIRTLNTIHPYLEGVDKPVPNEGIVWREFGVNTPVDPSVSCVDESVRVLGTYVDNGEAGFCVKDFGNWKSVFIGVTGLPVPLLRNIAKDAGVHIYNDHGDITETNGEYLSIHTFFGGSRTIKLPQVCDVYNAFTGKLLFCAVDSFHVELEPSSTSIYRLSF